MKPYYTKTELIKFVAPFDRDGFVSPELLKIKSVPSTVNYRTIYYSLGLLVAFCLLNKNLIQNGLKTDKEIEAMEKYKTMKGPNGWFTASKMYRTIIDEYDQLCK